MCCLFAWLVVFDVFFVASICMQLHWCGAFACICATSLYGLCMAVCMCVVVLCSFFLFLYFCRCLELKRERELEIGYRRMPKPKMYFVSSNDNNDDDELFIQNIYTSLFVFHSGSELVDYILDFNALFFKA